MNNNFIFLLIMSFILGCSIGSFANVCILRWLKEESIMKERSHCFTCGYQLKWYDNIPLISYILLNGKCRNCKSSISIQYPLVEFITGLLYLLIFYFNGLSWFTLKLMFITWMFVVATVTDIKQREIPNEIIFAGIGAFIINIFFDNTMNIPEMFIGLFIPSLPFLLIGIIYEKIANIEMAIGGGDIKFLFVIGGLMGGYFSSMILFGGCLALLLIYLPNMIINYKKIKSTPLPMMIGFSSAYLFILIYFYCLRGLSSF